MRYVGRTLGARTDDPCGEKEGGEAMMSVFGWLVTYLIHSTILLSLAWIADRFFLRNRPHWKEMVWRVALVGGLLTATAQAVLPWRPYAGTVFLADSEEK